MIIDGKRLLESDRVWFESAIAGHLEKMRVYRKSCSKDIPQEFARF